MRAVNRKTRSPIVGTAERIYGTARLVVDSFARDEAGELSFDHNGQTDVDWNSQETLDREGWIVFVDDDGEEVPENEIELIDGDEDDGPIVGGDGAALTADDIREFTGYLRNLTDAQVRGCYDKERAAGRDGYVALCEAEAARRGVALEG